MKATRSCLMLVATIVLLAGCGGDGGGSEGGDGDDGGGGPTADATDPVQRFAKTDISEVPLTSLQECPTDTTFDFPVLYRGVEAAATCGSATADVTVGSTKLAIRHGWCEIDSDYVNYHFGTTTPAGTMREDAPQYGPDGFGLNLGAQVKDAKPVDKDGTYVEHPSDEKTYGTTLVIEHDRQVWSADFQHDISVTLRGDRTQGSVTAANHDGTPISATFECGNRIVGDDAPAAGS